MGLYNHNPTADLGLLQKHMDGTVWAITGISGLVGGNRARTPLVQGSRVREIIHRDTQAVREMDVERANGDSNR